MKNFRGKNWRVLSYAAMPNGDHSPDFLSRLRIERDNFNLIQFDRQDDRIYVAYDQYNPTMIAEVLSEASVTFHDSVPLYAMSKAGGTLDLDMVLVAAVEESEGVEAVPAVTLEQFASVAGTAENGDTLYRITIVSIPMYHALTEGVNWLSASSAKQWIKDNVVFEDAEA